MNKLLTELWNYAQSRAFVQDLLGAAAVLGAFVIGAFAVRTLLVLLVGKRPVEEEDRLLRGVIRSLVNPLFWLLLLFGGWLGAGVLLHRSPIDVQILIDVAYAAASMSAFIVAAFLGRGLATWWLRRNEGRRQTLLGAVLESLVQPGFFLLLAVGGRVSAAMLLPGWPRAGALAHGTFYVATLFVGAYAAYCVGTAVLAWYDRRGRAIPDERVREHILMLARKVLKIALFAWACVAAIEYFGYDISTVLATVGIASLAVGLAAKETVENMICGVTIMLDRPFRAGDRIQLPDGKIGDVYEIGLRTCKILTLDHTMVVVPNSHIASSSVINLSYPNSVIRLETYIGVAYGTDPMLVKKALVRVGRETPDVVDNPPPVAYFYEHGDSSLKFVLMTWINSYKDFWELRDRLTTGVNLEFTRLGIHIPFPMRTVIIEQPNAAGKADAAVPAPPGPVAPGAESQP